MTDMDLKRAFVSDLYSGSRWRRRVAAMTDAQVVAIFLREKGKQSSPHATPKPKPTEESNDDTIPF